MQNVARKTLQNLSVRIPKEIVDAEIDVNLLTNPYIIAVINLSSDCLTVAGTRPLGGNDDQWKWTAIPKTCRNCTTNYDQCYKDKRYSPIMSTDCDSAPFELFVGFMIDDSNARGALFEINPSCQFAGAVIGVD
ncbi:hypothetical protein [Cupriavidus sp. AcVe19-6a]|uniref:hypothetical protein n=1 Tax=Cupriavidus sp. AcVe19-6a TaxID=2821358 RepID=UPI001AEB5975|nr:hypothetical protein [Cupriavidus sp. AcVe19-6a]MBP0634894.1 hypothetical protein [Cupriavidus sp. AcVe19-6a]